jgi:hypothetical protein
MTPDSEQKMVELMERPTTQTTSVRRTTPAAGCFGYTQQNRKPAPCEIRDMSVFAALFAKSL